MPKRVRSKHAKPAGLVAVRHVLDEADRLYASEGPSVRALQKAEQALRLEPRNVEALVIKGRILFDLDRPAREALACYERAIRVDPTYAEGFLERGRLLYALKKDNRRALRDVTRALARAGRDRWVRVEALRLRGHILGELDREREAMACYRAALRVNPRDPRTHWNLGESHLVAGQPHEALRCFEEALRILQRQRDPDQLVLGLTIDAKAESLNALGRHIEALRVVEAGLQRVKDKIARRALQALRRQTKRLVAGRKAGNRA